MPYKIEGSEQRARRVLSLALEEAERLRHSTVDTGHVLLGLMREEGGIAGQALLDLGLDLRHVEEVVQQVVPVSAASPGAPFDLSTTALQSLELAVDESRQLGHHYIGTEHLLLGLTRLKEGVALDVLKRLNVSTEEVRRQISRLMQEGPVIEQRPQNPHVPVEAPKTSPSQDSSAQWRVVLNNATQEAKRLNHNRVSTEHVLLAFLGDKQDRAGYLLRVLGLRSDHVQQSLPIVPDADHKAQLKIGFSSPLIAALGIAVVEAYHMASPSVQSEHILLGIVQSENSPAMAILAKAGITAEQVKKAIENVMK